MASAFPYLTVLVVLPAAGAGVAALVPRRLLWMARAVGLAVSLATLGVASAALAAFKVGRAGFQLTSRHVWISAFGISWHLGIDGISLLLVMLTALLFPIAFVLAPESRDPKAYVAWMLLLEAACLGTFLALDLILFFVFFEVSLVPVYFLIGGWGHENRAAAAVKFFIYTFLGSAFLLIGILASAFLVEHHTGKLSFDLLSLDKDPRLFAGGVGIALWLAFTAAFAIKAPVFPFHTWSPDAYAEAPTSAVVVLAGVMAKMGAYGIVRFDFELFPQATRTLSPVILTLATIGVVYGAIVSARQSDLKRLLAYSSLSNLGFIILGFFALTEQGVTGGVLQMVNHGIYTAGLFLLVGMLYQRTSSRNASQLGGLQRYLPIAAGVFMLCMLASIGLPGLNGFVGEFLILIGTFLTHRWWAVVAASGVVLASIYLLWAYQRVFHGKPRSDDQVVGIKDLSFREIAGLVPLMAIIVFIGVYPRPLLERITPSVESLLVHVEQSTGYRQPQVATAGKVALVRRGIMALHGQVVEDRAVIQGGHPERPVRTR